MGIAMIMLGVNILGNLNKEATSQLSLGISFWRIVIGSGIIVLVLGFLNVFAVSLVIGGHDAYPLSGTVSANWSIFVELRIS